MSDKSMDLLPEQCRECVKRDICLDNDCIKTKPCLTRLETKPVDVDLFNEMRERMGI